MGLMTIPPFYENPEKNRRNFSKLRELAEKIDKQGFPNWDEQISFNGNDR
jgi:uncharacterized pyridoxal phosphate-containing UPF0001 family protein